MTEFTMDDQYAFIEAIGKKLMTIVYDEVLSQQFIDLNMRRCPD